VYQWSGAHNAIVTITYSGGTVLQAVLLSHEEHEIRAIAAGCEDVLTFTCIGGTWVSEENEPVGIRFAWQGGRAAPIAPEAEYICPKELADHLITTMLHPPGPDGVDAKDLYVFSKEGTRVPIRPTELDLQKWLEAGARIVN